MSTLLDQLQAFAKAHGGTVRTGPQPRKPISLDPPSIGRSQSIQSPPKADPHLNYTDDYSVWKQGQ